jgi:hypothetical protein
MSDISNNITYPEEWDDIIKLMSYEDISKINSGFMRMTKGEKISFMKLLIDETKKELEGQGLTTNLKELN